MCDLGSHCLHLYYNCPRKDSGAQSYSHQGKRLPAYTPGALGYYSIQIWCIQFSALVC